MPNFLFEGNQVAIENGDTVLDAILRAGENVDHGCKAGACQSCLLRTQSAVSAKSQNGLDPSTVALGGFLACQTPPMIDMVVTRFDPTFFPTYEATVLKKDWLASDVCRLKLAVPDLDFCPGRFIQLLHSSGVKRPYSVATSALGTRDHVELHIRILPNGQMSKVVTNALEGEVFQVQGPFGKCCYNPATQTQDMLLIGSGTGLAPLIAIAADALAHQHSGHIWLYHGSATSQGLYLDTALRELDDQYENFHYFACVDSGAKGAILLGSPLEAALTRLSTLDGMIVYLCGHPGLVKAAQKRCFLAGARLKDIHADPFEATC